MRKKREVKTVYFRCLSELDINTFGMAIICVGRTNALPGYTFGPFQKKDNVLTIVCGGHGTVRTPNGEEEFCAGDVLGYLQDQSYMWWTDPKSLLEHYWITLEGDGGKKCLQTLGFSESTCILKRKKVPEQEITLLEQLMECCRSQPQSPSWKAMSLFYDICTSVSCTTGVSSNDAPIHGSVVADAAHEIIDSRYTQNLSINMIAHQVGVTPEYLATAFKQRFGVTPQAYLIQLRLNRAAALLKAGVSVKEACYSVGYKDPNYFTTLFHKKEGITPSSLRNCKTNLAN